MFSQFFSILISVIIGYSVILLVLPEIHKITGLFFRLFLSTGVGFGISSLLFFLWLLTFGSARNFAIAEILVSIILVAVVFINSRKNNFPISDYFLPKSLKNKKSNLILNICFWIILTAGVIYFLLIILNGTHGESDAFHIWNYRARFLFSAKDFYWLESIRDAFPGFRGDYPLLLPSVVAKNWTYSGNISQVSPMLSSMTFTFATIGLLVTSLSLLKSKNQGLIAGIVLLGTEFFLKKGAHQIADVPVSFYVLATIVLLYIYEKNKNLPGFLFLSGLTGGFAAWTKNEGLLFLTMVIVFRFIFALFLRPFKEMKREFLWFAAGLSFIAPIIIYFKFCIAPPNHIFHGQKSFKSLLNKLTDLSRYLKLIMAYLLYSLNYILGGILPLMLISFYTLFSGFKFKKDEKFIALCSVLIVISMLIGYGIVNIITPLGLDWQLKNIPRLLLHLWPAIIFIYFMAIKELNSCC